MFQQFCVPAEILVFIVILLRAPPSRFLITGEMAASESIFGWINQVSE
jgi:hypothetical protein